MAEDLSTWRLSDGVILNQSPIDFKELKAFEDARAEQMLERLRAAEAFNQVGILDNLERSKGEGEGEGEAW